jgi:hypothetical protein
MTLAFALGLSTLSAMAQDENDAAAPNGRGPRADAPRVEREARRAQRPPAEDADQGGPSDEARPAPPQRQESPGTWQRPGRGRPNFRGGQPGPGYGRFEPPATTDEQEYNRPPLNRRPGPRGEWGTAGPGFCGGARPFGPPGMGRRGLGADENVCPFCGRPLLGPGFGPQQGHARWMARGYAWEEYGFGPGRPGFGQQRRGWGFGPFAQGPDRQTWGPQRDGARAEQSGPRDRGEQYGPGRRMMRQDFGPAQRPGGPGRPQWQRPPMGPDNAGPGMEDEDAPPQGRE